MALRLVCISRERCAHPTKRARRISRTSQRSHRQTTRTTTTTISTTTTMTAAQATGETDDLTPFYRHPMESNNGNHSRTTKKPLMSEMSFVVFFARRCHACNLHMQKRSSRTASTTAAAQQQQQKTHLMNNEHSHSHHSARCCPSTDSNDECGGMVNTHACAVNA